MKAFPLILLFIIMLFINGCSSYHYNSSPLSISDSKNLPKPNITVKIDALGPCHDDLKHPISFNSKEPVTILVHGCYASDGEFRSLSKVLAHHGQQAFCFRYNDRDSLVKSAEELTNVINKISSYLDNPQINVIGHSMGGLIARKALVKNIDQKVKIKLATVSTPFSGIDASRNCANCYLRLGTFGIHDLVCWAISGDKWDDITYASNFIKNPGELPPNITKHLLIATDERDSCRYIDKNNQCIEDDYVFSLKEQELPNIKNKNQKNLIVKAGHVEIVGKYHHTPKKLINILENEGFIDTTISSEKISYNNFLDKLYGKL